MNKNELFARYSHILDSLIDNSLWFKTYFQQPWMLDENIDGDWEAEVPYHVEICGGATRDCIVDKDLDWVVKFDIDEDEGGSCTEREVAIYEEACARGMEKYFAEVHYIGTYTRTYTFYDFHKIDFKMNWYGFDTDVFNAEFIEHEDEFGEMREITISLPLYAYRKASHHLCGCPSEKERTIAQKVKSPLRARHIVIATDFIREFGLDEYVRFSRFACEWGINDLHFGNIGEIDDHLCLIDYSGYHSGDSVTGDSWEM